MRELVPTESGSGLDIAQGCGRGRSTAYGGQWREKEDDSDEIRTRAGNPSRIEGWT